MRSSEFDDDDAPGLDPALRCALDERLRLSPDREAAALARVKARVMAVIRPEYRTVSASEDGWETTAPGVQRKMLWKSATTQSCMVRLAPGASVAAHAHGLDEECVVLEGTLHIGSDIHLHKGDFHIGLAGSRHETASTETGALVYLRGELEEA